MRNYQARNFLRDQVQVGDGVLVYHSSADPPCIAGIAEVVRAAHPDPTAFDREATALRPQERSGESDLVPGFDQGGAGDRAAARPSAFEDGASELAGMELLRKGSRLSVQPVTESEWKTILALARSKTTR